ncbi:hypothetical protein [Paenibacillus germinis]|uniref:hypothetical protein n=1 Tax=Paenibacillus germinis TaxID=2654979 RepID=UPI001491F6AF|nr:hypothetical protein [Paenibacillus germinis]
MAVVKAREQDVELLARLLPKCKPIGAERLLFYFLTVGTIWNNNENNKTTGQSLLFQFVERRRI